MKQDLIFPNSGFPEPTLGSIPFPRYADWIFGHVPELHRAGQLEHLQQRESKNLDWKPFEIRPDNAQKPL